MPRIRQKRAEYLNEDFRRAVKARLALLGMEQNHLAELLSVDKSTVSNLLKYPGKLSVDRLRKIAEFLGMDAADVLHLLGYGAKVIREATANTAGLRPDDFPGEKTISSVTALP